jgi:hypothetical protein
LLYGFDSRAARCLSGSDSAFKHLRKFRALAGALGVPQRGLRTGAPPVAEASDGEQGERKEYFEQSEERRLCGRPEESASRKGGGSVYATNFSRRKSPP